MKRLSGFFAGVLLAAAMGAGAATAVYTYFVPGGALGGGPTSQTVDLTATGYLTGPLGVPLGGDGLTSATLGDLRYGSGTNTLSTLPGNTTSTKKFLTQTGTGSVSAAPAWGTISYSDVSGTPAAILTGTTGSIGGSALAAGACAAGTATVTGATTAMAVSTSPSADPDSTLTTGVAMYAFVSASNTVTVRVCAIVAVTPTATTYNVRVIP